MNTFDYIKYYTDKSIRDNYQISNATIKRVHTNSTYDIVTIIGSDDYPLFNISPVDPKVKFSVEDSVTVLIPVGNKQLTRILGYSNIQFPAEEVIEFNEPTITVTSNIYLCDSSGDGKLIKVYSLDGTAGTDIPTTNFYCFNICADSEYIYVSSDNDGEVHKYTIAGVFVEDIFS